MCNTVQYRLTDVNWLPASQLSMLLSLSEHYADHHTVDGDVFDECTDRAISMFLALAEREEGECRRIWENWMTREGRETYAYMTVDTLLAAFAVDSIEATPDQRTVLMPVQATDVTERDRGYYNRYLRRNLPNPLRDAKQLVLFSHIPIADSDALGSAMHCVRQWCSRANLARVYAAVNTGA